MLSANHMKNLYIPCGLPTKNVAKPNSDGRLPGLARAEHHRGHNTRSAPWEDSKSAVA